MSSMVLWSDDRNRIVASWHKGDTFTVTHYGEANEQGISPVLSKSNHRTNALAVRAAKRLSKMQPNMSWEELNPRKAAAEKAKVEAICRSYGFDDWHTGGGI